MQFLRVAATVGRLDSHIPLAALTGVGALIWGGCFFSPRFGIRASCSSGGAEGWSKSEQYVQECSQSEGEISPLSGAPCWLSEWSSAQLWHFQGFCSQILFKSDPVMSGYLTFGHVEGCTHVWDHKPLPDLIRNSQEGEVFLPCGVEASAETVFFAFKKNKKNK